MMYKQIELIEGVPVQYVGVHAVRWQREWGQPTVGFIENEYTLDDALNDIADIQFVDNTAKDAVRERAAVEQIIRRLCGEEE